jgi:diguanylate cyclase (GGDEF)-like protein
LAPAILQRAVQALKTQTLTEDLKQAALGGAHKLAGALGMFDRKEGSEIAKQLETLLSATVLLEQHPKLESLVQRLEPLLSLEQPVTSPIHPPPPSMRSWHILAVDDDPVVLATLKQQLEPWGMRVTPIDNPLHFWTVLSSITPDLLILDVEMPQINGIALCQAIRANPTWQSLPILFLTAHQDASTIQQIFAAGADDYIPKPLIGQELMSRMTQRLERLRLLQTLTTKDAITGLPNQFNSSQAIDTQLFSQQSTCFAILFIPSLRRINIQQGHSIGNQILKQTGQVLQTRFCQGEILGYWGNGEFIIASSQGSKAQFQQQLLEVIDKLQNSSITNQDQVPVDYHFAVVAYPMQGLTLRSLYQTASLGLESYLSERTGVMQP